MRKFLAIAAFAIAAMATAAYAAAQDFTIHNGTGHTVVTLNVSATSSNQWGPDLLGRDVLANGESAEITFDRNEGQCDWDIRATYDDGDTSDWRGINLCETTDVNLTP
jgi:opacity protein-like surface antigen